MEQWEIELAEENLKFYKEMLNARRKQQEDSPVIDGNLQDEIQRLLRGEVRETDNRRSEDDEMQD